MTVGILQNLMSFRKWTVAIDHEIFEWVPICNGLWITTYVTQPIAMDCRSIPKIDYRTVVRLIHRNQVAFNQSWNLDPINFHNLMTMPSSIWTLLKSYFVQTLFLSFYLVNQTAVDKAANMLVLTGYVVHVVYWPLGDVNEILGM